MIDFQTSPERYKHWRLSFAGPVATLTMDVAEDGGLIPGYDLKLNSYDLGVDIELYDAVQRLRFEHPEVKTVVLTSGRDNVFCAGANIRMLGQSSHGHKVNFCKFTNETRNSIEDASESSKQIWMAAVNGSCAGGGYELALATDHILLVDDGSTTVSLPELPLLAVLPGTGGLTRLTDKRKVRRDLADVFCTTEEGIRGKRALTLSRGSKASAAAVLGRVIGIMLALGSGANLLAELDVLDQDLLLALGRLAAAAGSELDVDDPAVELGVVDVNNSRMEGRR